MHLPRSNLASRSLAHARVRIPKGTAPAPAPQDEAAEQQEEAGDCSSSGRSRPPRGSNSHADDQMRWQTTSKKMDFKKSRLGITATEWFRVQSGSDKDLHATNVGFRYGRYQLT